MMRSLSLLLLLSAPALSQTPAAPLDPQLIAKAKKSTDKGLRFLRSQQNEDGSYGKHVGLTSIALLAFAESHRDYKVDDGPFISAAVRWLQAQIREDGAITGDSTPTYNTALAILAFQALDPKKFKNEIKGGQKFLLRFQSDEEQKYKKGDKFYGGIGYGGDERPDLSNLQYALEALKKSDYDPKSDVWSKAEIFINRCQNRSESNDQPWAGDDGGFVYAPGQSPVGGTQSYGSMTFAGLKSLIFVRAKKDDPRVQAAWSWIQKHYDFNEHPGFGTTGYFYYLQTAAGALEAFGEAYVPDPKGRKRDWRLDLAEKLISLQGKDGSWINKDPKYWEGNATLSTARAVTSINHILRATGAIK